jgi:hypothetical protein
MNGGPLPGETACAAANASACLLAPSECLDDKTLLYFSNPRCADAGSGLRCETEAHTLGCGYRGCLNGGCGPRSTLAL